MLYKLLHFPARLAFTIWCRHIKINQPAIVKIKGPVLLAANHPNSFLDAIMLCSIFKQPIYSLARGDAFKGKLINHILRSLKMFPVYRLSEGAHNLDENYKTFDECIEVFKQNHIVLIFSEGRCINEWHLRPLKKGTARLALSAWQQNIPLQVIPIGINYSSFTSFGKNVELNIGSPITHQQIEHNNAVGTQIQTFNQQLQQQLQQLVFESKPVNKKIVQQYFRVEISSIKKTLLVIPATLGYILHAPLYIPIQKFAFKKFGKIDHYDSVMVGLLFLTYPIYVLLITIIIAFFISGYWWLLTPFILSFCAYSFVQIKKQF
ncbi:1-acyl-sn-glycerol-3-phosphate acyltransferase [Ferruginibacter yonginensis]|uniref:1-acyl-sn-glycerol-3-phosphate acyltransferase n=1 Tax=Ferruginibacter yonginensis TaxID=1310416 RepID=A0ABV8QT30_9BACT